MSYIVSRKGIQMRKKLNGLLDTFIGKELLDINLVCEMMCFNFGEMSFHAQGFTRVLQNDEVLVTTLDYQHWDEVDDKNNDEWLNMNQCKNVIINNKIERIDLLSNNDVFIYLENGICIQSFNCNGPLHFSDYNEQWRFVLNSNENNVHIVAQGKMIEFL